MHKGSEPVSRGGTAWNGGAALAKRLDELLVERNDVQQADIDKALQIQRTVGGRLGPHHIDRLLDFVRKERAIEDLYSGDSARQLREMAEEAPIIELVNNLLSQAVDAGASDIHVEPAEDQFAVRMRVDGVLHTRLTQPVERFPAVASRIKLISGIDIAERRLPQDGRISTRIAGREMDIRVSMAAAIPNSRAPLTRPPARSSGGRASASPSVGADSRSPTTSTTSSRRASSPASSPRCCAPSPPSTRRTAGAA